MPKGIRGVRTSLQAGTLVGRLGTRGGPGQAQQVSTSDLAASLIGTGQLALPGAPSTAASIADSRIMANISGGSAPPAADTLTAILDHIMGSAEGQILQRGASAWQVLAPGTANQVLASGGAAALNAWSGLSALLDAIFGNTEGQVLQRGVSAWQVLAPGTAGQVLTSGGAGALNSWTTPIGGTTISDDGTWNSLSGYSVGQVVRYNGQAYLDYVAIAAPAGAAAAWNGSDDHLMTLSTTNTTNDTATTQAGSSYANSTAPSKSSGKWYFEFQCSNLLDNGTTVGIATVGAADNFGGNALGGIGGSAGFAGHGSGSFAGLTNNKRGAVAVDLTGNLFWITADVTAVPIVWNGSSANTPGTGAGGISLGTPPGAVLEDFQAPTSSGQHCVLYTTGAAFSIPAIPSGFAAWSANAVPSPPPDQDSAHWVGITIPVDSLFSYEHLGGV